jgi:hypothetical protein
MTPFFIIVKPDEINGRLAALGNKILVHLPNYFPVYHSQPVIADDSKQVFKILVADDLFDEIDEGGVIQPRLWQGAKGQRSRPGDLVTVEVTAASNDLSDLPPNVQLAAALVANAEVVPVLEARTVGQINEWALAQLTQFEKG